MEAIALTDLDWFHRLREASPGEPINFWTPSGWHPKKLEPGERLFFLLKAPIRKVGGYGRFVEFKLMGVAEAWEAYGERNGVGSLSELAEKTGSFVGDERGASEAAEGDRIGCIILEGCELWADDELLETQEVGVEVPDPVVTFKYLPKEADVPERRGRACWWVNQGESYEREREAGCLWARGTAANGARLAHHERVGKARAGDVTLHYVDGEIRAIGRITVDGRRDRCPYDRDDVDLEQEGFVADVAYFELPEPVALAEIPYPIRSTGEGPFTTPGGVQPSFRCRALMCR